MLYDRSYMREDPHFRGNTPTQSCIKWILIVNVAIFILQHIFLVWLDNNTFLERTFSLTTGGMQRGYLWTLITYSFLHGPLFHIMMNMWLIYMIGRHLEPTLGSRQFMHLYLGSALFGGITWILMSGSPGQQLVGASGSALGLLTVFCLMRPNTPVMLIFPPVVLKPKWILWGVLGLEVFGLLFDELGPQRSSVAHSAHLGGMLGGFLFYKWILNRDFNLFPEAIKVEKPKWFSKGNKKQQNQPSFRINITSTESVRQKVDKVLDKINTSGFGSLTDEEKDLLDKARDILKK